MDHGREVIDWAIDLGFAYWTDRFAVRGLNFEPYRGEVFGLLGRNGAEADRNPSIGTLGLKADGAPELGAIVEAPRGHDLPDPADVADPLGRVPLDQDQVGALSDGERPRFRL